MAAFAAPIIGSLLGGLSGLFNRRPPALNPAQETGLNTIIPDLLKGATGTPTIDPTQQALMYGNIAQSQTGANNAVTNSLVSRGLGRSGILGNALIQVANQAQAGRNQADLGLQQQAIQRQQFDIGSLLQALNVNATGGQSSAGAFFAGIAPIAAYSLQNMLNNRGGGGAFGGSLTPPGITPMPSGSEGGL